MRKKEVQTISKRLSFILNKAEDGWMDVDSAIENLKAQTKLKDISMSDLVTISEKYESQNFEIQGNKIRAKKKTKAKPKVKAKAKAAKKTKKKKTAKDKVEVKEPEVAVVETPELPTYLYKVATAKEVTVLMAKGYEGLVFDSEEKALADKEGDGLYVMVSFRTDNVKTEYRDSGWHLLEPKPESIAEVEFRK